MNYYHVLIISLCSLVTHAKDVQIGSSCTISDDDDDFDDVDKVLTFDKATKDVEVADFKKSYSFTEGKITVTTPVIGESGEDYIVVKSSSTSVQISIDSKLFKETFEENIQTHLDAKDNFLLIRTIAFACGNEPAVEYELQIEIEDTNDHPPKFLNDPYKLQLGKMIIPDVDITTVNDQPLITVEDIDFTNTEIDVAINDERFKIEAEAMEGNRKFKIRIEANEAVNITDPITFTITASDTDKKSATAVLTISAPNLIGDCTVEDRGLLEYGFFEYTIQDTDVDFQLPFEVSGPLAIQLADENKTGDWFINIDLNDEKTQLVFSLSDNFKDDFETSIISEKRQSVMAMYRSGVLSCGEAKQGFTFGLLVEDTNTYEPSFVDKDLHYKLPKTLMPKVDLTSSGDKLLVEDLDFSNTDITFTADPPFIMESVYEDTNENKRRYRGILRVPSYYTIEGDSLEVNIIATDNGTPPLSTTGKIILDVEK